MNLKDLKISKRSVDETGRFLDCLLDDLKWVSVCIIDGNMHIVSMSQNSELHPMELSFLVDMHVDKYIKYGIIDFNVDNGKYTVGQNRFKKIGP